MKGRVRRLTLLSVAGLVVSAFAAGHAISSSAKTPAALPQLPTALNGLVVTPEKITGALSQREGQQYLQAVELVSLRGPQQQLDATLQIGRFNDGVDATSPTFQRDVTSNVGGSVTAIIRAANHVVYVTTYNSLTVLVWFSERDMFVLSESQTYPQPKTLLSAALAALP